MRHVFISGLIVSSVMMLATLTTASATERYPTQKHYVNQVGQVVAVGASTQLTSYAPIRPVRALPPVQIVPVAKAPVMATPVRLSPAPRLATNRGLLGTVNTDPADWPSGRTCCRPGQAYFNENPDS